MTTRLYEIARYIYHRVTPRWYPDIIPFDNAFPTASKICHAKAKAVEVGLSKVPVKPDARYLDSDTYVVPEDFSALLRDVYVSSTHEVVMPSRTSVLEESSNAAREKYFPHFYFQRQQIKELKGPVTLLRSRFHNYYHLLIDVLPRLVAIRDVAQQLGQVPKLLCQGQLSPVESFYIKKLGLGHLPIVKMQNDTLYRCEEYLFTTLKTKPQSGYVPSQYINSIQRAVLEDQPAERRSRVFISRKKAKRRRISNYDDLLRLLHRYDFEEIVFEDLAPEEQARVMNSASIVVGTHGAGLSNLLFSQPGAIVVEIFPTSHMIPHYKFLSESLNLKYYAISGNEYHHQIDEFEVNINDIYELMRDIDSLSQVT
jgi:hypothetical protein